RARWLWHKSVWEKGKLVLPGICATEPYTIEEIYAGDADGYNPPKSPESSGYIFPAFQILGSAIVCGTFHICNDPSIAVNIAAERLNDVTRNVTRDARPDQLPGEK
ncbi:hypothetical protein PWG14_28290, partial [Chromobacterium amazonense]|uniref:hypothetical protein n=1 Tax=Chromobacterium amazonense TaxID=1382803 RepID=UPI00237E0C10